MLNKRTTQKKFKLEKRSIRYENERKHVTGIIQFNYTRFHYTLGRFAIRYIKTSPRRIRIRFILQ